MNFDCREIELSPIGGESKLGEIVWLMPASPVHKQFFISDLEWPVAQATSRGA